MTKQILAIIAILLCTTAAWAILGSTIMARSFNADSGLGDRVVSSWGGPQQQVPPSAISTKMVPREVETTTNGKIEKTTINDTVTKPLPIEQSRIKVGFDLEQRQKGLLWFATYRVAWSGQYLIRNESDAEEVTLKLVFPAADAIYDDLVFLVDGKPVPTTTREGAVLATINRAPGSVIRLNVGYRSQGLGAWHYSLGENVTQVRDFLLEMTTDFRDVDFPQGTMSPTEKKPIAGGWLLTWKYKNLVTGSKIGMVMPEKLQPGPLAGRISFFAPVSLVFFFFVIFVVTTLKHIRLHPMHYFFLATSFFAFHLLLAYLVDHISIHLAFVICSAVSVFLVVSYLRIVVGPRFAFVEAALAQLVYLVGFSYAFFFKGFTGLAITIGSILSLFLVMQLTARVNWARTEVEPA
ncbi:MAG TPA: inner membrane CreD family protein [Thermoanaerobaculia bacterium]|jgi:inner membrane protein involved in colicin E2 resistance|nr:inner membrane CreD family protein [Thermoanaerobaculia bacterium]